ncbi:MAG: mechanosensitive ion channel family protein [Candidatus Aenigmarchaeota archaeon]|nr:mechanosensitive ion channel family protein [Candidatus Aenigmarchaeota archaeon]
MDITGFAVMLDFAAIEAHVTGMLPTLILLAVFLGISLLVYKVITAGIKRGVLKRAKTKKQKNNVLVFLSLWRYAFTVLILVTIIFLLGGDITGLGVWAGLLTAALGWALQKPITGVAGWIMVIVKRPFQIGDRIQIGAVKGDVQEISLTHIYLKEIGGTIATEETSGRVIMIPNSKLFEQDIINYTLTDDYILEQVVVTLTYESDLDKAIDICRKAAEKVTKDFVDKMPKRPYIRTFFQQSGIDVKTRFYVPASDRIRVASELTQEIFRGIDKEKTTEIAYPHTEVVLRKKGQQRQL